MTKEAINELKKYTSERKNTEKIEVSVLALNRIIFALEQESDEDAISRQAAINIVGDMHGLARTDVLSDAIKQLKELPPVTPQEKESATIAKFHDFYPEDSATWPPADKELLVKNHVGDNFIAYLDYDDGEDGGWGFYSEDGEFIADITEIDAWMSIPQHERDKNYIPVWEKKAKTPIHLFNNDVPSPEEEKDR